MKYIITTVPDFYFVTAQILGVNLLYMMYTLHTFDSVVRVIALVYIFLTIIKLKVGFLDVLLRDITYNCPKYPPSDVREDLLPLKTVFVGKVT